MDVARFGDWATLSYTNAKVQENYSRRFSIRFPNEELPAARPHQTTPLAAQKYHMRWFDKHLPSDGSVAIRRFGVNLVGLSIAGPNARRVLKRMTDEDISGAAFRFMDVRQMDVNSAPCVVGRITYTGDLGYEIWMEPAYQRKVYEGIKQAGAEFGIVDFGMRALLSMRLEKNFPTWFRELRPIYGPYEGGMERFVKLSKNDFIGRDAAAKEHAEGPKRMRASFIVDALDADVMGDEPIWAKVGDTDYGTVEPPHGYGAPRFSHDGREIAKPDGGTMRDGAWRVVGWVTSGGFAHTIGQSMAQGYIPASLAANEETGLFEIEILGVRRPARITVQAPFDPAGEKMRS
jgi:dimethylglycine dehydrogenase